VRPLFIALVHYPVIDAAGEVVTTAITNLDVHDLARSARTYGCGRYFLVHPIQAQRDLVLRIREHWLTGSSGRRIPSRKEAIALVEVAVSLEDVYAALGGRDAIEVWVTAARDVEHAAKVTVAGARAELEGEGKPVLVLFGTGWGLDARVLAAADRALLPVRARAATGYNHLSVRAACAIILDRLLGARES
jgi:hypothetical protein